MNNKFEICDELHQIKFDQNKVYFIYSGMQSGKTDAIIKSMVLATRSHSNCLVLVRNMNVDKDQLTNRIRQHNDLNEKDDIGAANIVSPDTINEIAHAFMRDTSYQSSNTSKRPKNNFIALGNSNIGKILNELEKKIPNIDDARGVLIIDEADLYGLDFDRSAIRLTQVESHLQDLRKFFHTVILLSATPVASVFTNGDNKVTDVLSLPIPNNYFGVKRLKHIPTIPTKGVYNLNNDISNLTMFMDDIINTDNSFGLISTKDETKSHKEIINLLMPLYKDVIYLEFNNSKVKIFTMNTIAKSLNETPFKSMALALNAIQNLFIDKSFNIVVVSGKMAARGISFVSDDRTVHLTHQYLAPSKASAMDNIMQKIRLCGIYFDNPVLKLFCDQAVWDDIINMDLNFDQIIECMKNKSINDVIEIQEATVRKWIPLKKSKGTLMKTLNNNVFNGTFDNFRISKYYTCSVETMKIVGTELMSTADQTLLKGFLNLYRSIDKNTLSSGQVASHKREINMKKIQPIIKKYLKDPSIQAKYNLYGDFDINNSTFWNNTLIRIDDSQQLDNDIRKSKTDLWNIIIDDVGDETIIRIRITEQSFNKLTKNMQYYWYYNKMNIEVNTVDDSKNILIN